MIAYAGSEGEAVSDGAGDHGLYTGLLLKELARPELSVTEAVLAAHDAVLRDPDARQTPQISTSLNADVFLHDPPPARWTSVFVVGVSAYTALPPLRNPVTDAREIATVFRMMGYEVDLHLDPTGAALEAAAEQFVAAIERGRARQSPMVTPGAAPETMGWQQPPGASSSALLHRVGLKAGYAPPTELPEPSGPTPGSLAIVYFAGSGIEVDDRSLFPATDAPAGPESDVLSRWFDVSEFVRRLERAASARIVILDFCRDNPFAPTSTR